MTSLFSRSSRFFCGLFLSSWIRIRMNPDPIQIRIRNSEFNLSLVEQASNVAGSQWSSCSRGVPASFVSYFCPPGSGSGSAWIRIQSRSGFETVNSTSDLLNKFPSSQEVNDLLVLADFPLLLWVIFVRMRMNPDAIKIRIRNSEIQPQSCWTSFRRRRKSMISLISRSSRFFCGFFLSAWIRIRIRITVNSTSVLLNKFPSSQEFNDLLVLEEFPLLLVENIVEDGGVHEQRSNPHHLVGPRGWRRRVQARKAAALSYLSSFKGTVSRDGFGLWGHAWSVLNRGRSQFLNFLGAPMIFEKKSGISLNLLQSWRGVRNYPLLRFLTDKDTQPRQLDQWQVWSRRKRIQRCVRTCPSDRQPPTQPAGPVSSVADPWHFGVDPD